jgi:acyl-coenzyme A thioesterase PaaI-like protein
MLSLQDQFAPNLVCFGCGPANEKGLQIKSFVEGDKVVATFTPQPHHIAFEGMINGGIIGVLLDCHLNWTAAWHLMQKNKLEKPPCCVTAKYEVTFNFPTPSGVPLRLESWILESSERKAVVSGTIGPVLDSESIVHAPANSVASENQATALGQGTFVAVKPGHPAYHRW